MMDVRVVNCHDVVKDQALACGILAAATSRTRSFSPMNTGEALGGFYPSYVLPATNFLVLSAAKTSCLLPC